MTALPKPSLSADVGGAVTNHVSVRGPKGALSRGRKPPGPKPKTRTSVSKPEPASASRALVAFRAAPLERAMDTAITTVSMPVGELAVLDAMCARTQMSRSHFVRQAVKHFAAKLDGLHSSAPPTHTNEKP